MSSIPTAPKPLNDPYTAVARLYGICLDPFILGWKKKALKLWQPHTDMAVLDAGSGTGAQLNLYRARGCRVFGIDLSSGMIAAARRANRTSLNLCRGNAARMPYRDGTFDLILLSMMLHEIAADTRSTVLVESKRVLKAGGRILIIDYRADRTPTPMGRLLQVVIRLVEMAAGRPHFTNYRNFIGSGGLPPLLKTHRLAVERQDRAGRGNIDLLLVRNDP